ncbi:MAG: DUF2798 domain-containing protein [Bifidobacteriaceae bacterium]|jgi:hypothetical protein|nr:DUF2798 domain-containing protein [Bifidobacteriaceae bacterium]
MKPPDGVVAPRTAGQRLVFTTIGVLLMVTVMALFNKAVEHGGLSWELFKQWPKAFVLRAPLAFPLQFFLVQKFAGRLSARYQVTNRIEYYVIRAGFTVMMMCPVMSCYSCFLYVGFTSEFIPVWLTKMTVNWAFAFGVQVFVLGPLTRGIFKRVVRVRPAG